jgi:lysophospholipase L1-like esterase
MANNFWNRLRSILTGVFLGCQVLTARSSSAAEAITVRYGLFTQSVAIADLRQYAETGNASISLQNFLRYLKREEKTAFRSALQTQMPVNLVALDRVLNSSVGQQLLGQVAQADDRRDTAGVQALRSALILGIKSGEISILSALEAYPNARLTINLPQALQVLAVSTPHPPRDQLPMILAWQTLVEYQAIVTQGQHYQGCLFGDSISSGLGDSLGEHRFNFAIGGMSSVSLVEQLKTLVARQVHCQTVTLAIGTNDAWYHIDEEPFKQNMTQIFRLVRSLSAKQIEVLPAFYSTIAASQNPELAGPLQRVEKINRWLREVAAEQQVPIAATALELLFEQKELKESLTTDGVHLNAAGRAIYLKVLLQLLAEHS